VNRLIIYMFTFLIAVLLNVYSHGDEGNYGNGYQKGYQKGYQFQEDGGIEPIPPVPPIPPIPVIGESGYDDGYRRGVIEGHENRDD